MQTGLELTPRTVAAEHEYVRGRADVVVPLTNAVRTDLGSHFGTTVPPIDRAEYLGVVDDVFADGDRAVNVAALSLVLRKLDVAGDYPGFVVDELLGRELAATIAGGQPLRLLAEATFHVADTAHSHGDAGAPAGVDDLDAALAAGVQTVLPGWDWRESASPFALDL
jgi:hypothetical protein